MSVFHVFYIVQTAPNRAKCLIYLEYECHFKEEMLMNKEQLTTISPTEDLKLQTS